jgi:dTDP-4-dehydrorhamnose 3,5-epimerase
MTIEKTPFEGLLILKPTVFVDNRGSFLESWNKDEFLKMGLNLEFVQDNQSVSAANVIRGLHFQVEPLGQGKLVRVARGSVLDVAVDLRKDQKTFGKHFKIILDGTDNTMIYIPEGFAHGFRSLEDNTHLLYKCTKPYSQDHEMAIKWNDPDLFIDWGIKEPIVSDKDEGAPSFQYLLKNSNL